MFRLSAGMMFKASPTKRRAITTTPARETGRALESSDVITTAALPDVFLHPAGLPPASSLEGFDLPADGLDLEAYLEWLGKRLMQQALERTGGVQIRAAELLRMSERSFRYYAKKYGIRRDGEETTDERAQSPSPVEES